MNSMMAPASSMHHGVQSVPEQRMKILLVDDTPENLVSLEAALSGLAPRDPWCCQYQSPPPAASMIRLLQA